MVNYLCGFKRKLWNNCLSYCNVSCIYTSGTGLQPPWRIMFLGTDNFSLKSLQSLCSKLRTGTYISELCVTTSIERNRTKNVVHSFACEEHLKIYEWPLNVDDILNKFDVGVVSSFGHLIPSDVINAFPLGILNVHGSLLPRWRGATPVVHAIMEGDLETGVTIMKIKPHKFDVGDIVRQYSISIRPNETTPELTDRLAEVGARLLIECIRDLPNSVYRAVEQPSRNSSYARKLKSEMSVVKWSEMNAERVYNLHRAVGHVYPLKTKWLEHEVKLYDVSVDTEHSVPMIYDGQTIAAGLVRFRNNDSVLLVQCADGKWIIVRNVKITGRKLISPKDFRNGYLDRIPEQLNRRFR